MILIDVYISKIKLYHTFVYASYIASNMLCSELQPHLHCPYHITKYIVLSATKSSN